MLWKGPGSQCTKDARPRGRTSFECTASAGGFSRASLARENPPRTERQLMFGLEVRSPSGIGKQVSLETVPTLGL